MWEDVFSKFRQHADAGVAIGLSRYMRDQFEFLGIQTPVRRSLSANFITGQREYPINWVFISECWKQVEREFQYLAVDYIKFWQGKLIEDDFFKLGELVLKKPWWDTVDSLARVFGELVFRFPNLEDKIIRCAQVENIWVKRIAILHQLCMKSRLDASRMEKILVMCMGSEEFFINKAIGWALRDYSKWNSEWVELFIGRYKKRLNPLSISEGSKYI